MMKKYLEVILYANSLTYIDFFSQKSLNKYSISK